MSLCCSGFAVGLVLAAAIHCPVGVARFRLRVDLSSFQFGGVGLPLRLRLALRPVQRYHYKNSFGSRTGFGRSLPQQEQNCATIWQNALFYTRLEASVGVAC